jgi:hypothetical protein
VVIPRGAAAILSFTPVTTAPAAATALAAVSVEMAEVVEEANRPLPRLFFKEDTGMKEKLMFAWIAPWFALIIWEAIEPVKENLKAGQENRRAFSLVELISIIRRKVQ